VINNIEDTYEAKGGTCIEKEEDKNTERNYETDFIPGYICEKKTMCDTEFYC
jgi:hypothetical protein